MKKNYLEDYIHVVKVDYQSGEFLETVATCDSHDEATRVMDEFNDANNFPREVEYTYSNERAEEGSSQERKINK